MKKEHKEILNKIEKYLSQPGSEHLRFWQALRNIDVIKFEESGVNNSNYKYPKPIDDYNISDKELLNRIHG